MTDDDLKRFLVRVYSLAFHGHHSAVTELLGDKLEDLGVNLDSFI